MGGPAFDGGYPRMVELNDGTLLMTVDMDGGIHVWKSWDKGATWHAPDGSDNPAKKIAVPNPNPTVFEHTAVNGVPVVLPNGHILIAYAEAFYKYPIIPEHFFHIKIRRSVDGGVTWHHLSTPLDFNLDPNHGALEPGLYLGNGGQEVRLIYTRAIDNNGTAIMEERRSFDGGVTWSVKQDGGRLGTGKKCQMGNAVQAENGRYIMVFEMNPDPTGNGNIFVIGMLEQAEDENAWENFRIVYAPEFGGNAYGAGAPFIVRLADGRLLCSFQEKDHLDNNPPCTFSYVISKDNGVTWGRKTSVFDPGEWNAVFVDSDGYVYAITTGIRLRKTLQPLLDNRP